jgi:hypothetical protein
MVDRRERKLQLFSKEMLICNREAAQRHGVEAACHEKDFIYQFVVRRFRAIKPAVDYYFDDGARSAGQLATIIDQLQIGKQPVSLLEFASGYGCVTRHLKRIHVFRLCPAIFIQTQSRSWKRR